MHQIVIKRCYVRKWHQSARHVLYRVYYTPPRMEFLLARVDRCLEGLDLGLGLGSWVWNGRVSSERVAPCLCLDVQDVLCTID